MPYDPNFIQGFTLPLPTLGTRTSQTAFNAGTPIEHTRFSLVFDQVRNFAIYTAHNIDGASILHPGIRRRNNFRLDPAVPRHIQVDNDRGYHRNPWDRGHLVRRRSLHWQDRDEAAQADSESFYWTNIVPQHENLHDTAWGQIEDWILKLADDNDKRACIFTGPVLTLDDPEYQNKRNELPIRIPAGFWKITVIKCNGDCLAAAFLVWQRDYDRPEPLDFDPILEQVRVTTIEYLTGIRFETLRDADPLRFGADITQNRVTGVVISSPQNICT